VNRVKLTARTLTVGTVVAATYLLICGCIYDVPITAKPTRTIDTRLLGNWTSRDGKDKMKVVKLDASHYIVSCNGDLNGADPSDLAGTPFASVQKLESDKTQYAYWTWKLSDDDTQNLRKVNDKVIPDDTKDTATVQGLLKENLQNPELFGDEVQMSRDK